MNEPAPTPAETIPTVKYGMGRYSLFQGSLVITGWVQVMGAPITGVKLVLPDDQVFPLTLKTETGDEGSTRFSFDQRFELKTKASDLASGELVIDTQDQQQHKITNPGQPQGDGTHQALETFINAMQAQGKPGHLLEIGARARSSIARRHFAPKDWQYTGLDIMEGPNVDVTGDAHSLSRHFRKNTFDAVMSFSVFEHLLMPWKVAIELSKVMKTGGIGLVMTHQTWPLHEQPWDFWRFSDQAWHAIFNPATGFVIEQAVIGEQAFIVPRMCHPTNAFDEHYEGSLSSAVLFRKVGRSSVKWPVELDAVLPTAYPKGETVIDGKVTGVQSTE
ncbi:MAG: class I SAM-dependent methyltransferase [Alphaproteobacteria bacterium]|nr:class I SAM-dependent methyltransferase [Alphaproteobacteria bacterium SS10]